MMMKMGNESVYHLCFSINLYFLQTTKRNDCADIPLVHGEWYFKSARSEEMAGKCLVPLPGMSSNKLSGHSKKVLLLEAHRYLFTFAGIYT